MLAFVIGMNEQGPRRLWVIVMAVFVCRCLRLMLKAG